MRNFKKDGMGNLCKLTKYFMIVLFCNLLAFVAKGQKLKEFIAHKKESFSGKFEDS